MNYNQRNVTYISELPELEDLEKNENTKKGIKSYHIKEPMRLSHMSGMSYRHGDYGPSRENLSDPIIDHPEERYENFHHRYSSPCMDLANHMKDCPICSRFYNNDRMMYIIAIVLLSLLCLMLIKKILNL